MCGRFTQNYTREQVAFLDAFGAPRNLRPGVVAALGLAVWILRLWGHAGERHVEPWGSRSPNRASR
jgi:hypothetical protein